METSPQNQYNHPKRRYAGVGKNLLCFAMYHSFLIEYDGFVGLYAKKNYNEKYYQAIGGICTHESEGRPFYTFFPDKSRNLIKSHMAGGVTICPN